MKNFIKFILRIVVGKKFFNICYLIISTNYLLYAIDTGFSSDADRIGRNVISETAKPYQIFYNPAGIYNITGPELFFDYGILYNNLTDGSKFVNNTLGIVKNVKGHGLGVGINQFGLKDWYIKDTVVLSYAKDIKKFLPKIVIGARINIINEMYVLDEYMKLNPVFANTNSKTVLGISLGGQYIQNYNIWSLMIENLNQPDVGFYSTEILPIELKVGYKHSLENLNFFATVGIINSIKPQNWVGIAAEYDFILFKILKLTPSLGINFGSDNYLMSYIGFILQTEKFTFSYSANIDPLNKIGLVAQHRISVGYKFVPVPIEKQTVNKTEYDDIVVEREKLIKQIESLKAEIKLLQESKTFVERKEIKQKTPQVISPSKKIEKEEKLPEVKDIKQEEPVLPQEQQQLPVIEPVQEKPKESGVPTTEQILLEKLQSLEQKLKEVDKKKTEPVKPAVVTPPSVSPQQPPVPKKRFHTVVAGDSLPSIAQKYYGDSSKWKIIYEANKDKIVRGQLLPGTVLEIP